MGKRKSFSRLNRPKISFFPHFSRLENDPTFFHTLQDFAGTLHLELAHHERSPFVMSIAQLNATPYPNHLRFYSLLHDCHRVDSKRKYDSVGNS